MGSDQCSSPVREMCVCSHDRLPGIKYYKQIDLEKSFFGSGQGETMEFGADQCKHFISFVKFHSVPTSPPGILVRDDAVRDRLQQRVGNSIIMSVLKFLRWLFT